MSQQQSQLPDNELPEIKRFITDHDANGKAVVNSAVPDLLPWQEVGGGARFGLAYATEQSPVDLSNGTDIETYKKISETLGTRNQKL